MHRALSGNLISYFYSIEWPIFAVLAGVAWWQLIHDDQRPGLGAPVTPVATDQASDRRRSWWRGSAEQEPSTPAIHWDRSEESPELAAYNQYLKALAAGGGKKTWRNPHGLPETPAGAR